MTDTTKGHGLTNTYTVQQEIIAEQHFHEFYRFTFAKPKYFISDIHDYVGFT
jgi:hypothetical protein